MTVARVTLDAPAIAGDQIRFNWTEDPVLGGNGTSELTYGYDGIDITQFSQSLWMELWLSQQLRAYLGFQGAIAIQLPSPAARATVDFWLAYYDLTNVSIAPVDPSDDYDPFVTGPRPIGGQHFSAGVFFGGGRDSLSSACLLGEIYGREQVLLMTCIDPGEPGEKPQQERRERYERQMLQPARRAGFEVQTVSTSLHALRAPYRNSPREPHLEQYTAGLLPVMLARNVAVSTFCYAWYEYVILHEADGLRFRYPRSRPETLAAMSRHYQRVLGFSHTATDMNLTMSDSLALRLLHERYPEMLPQVMMCQSGGPNNRWCYNCINCAYYAWSCLGMGVPDATFDFSRMLTRSRWVNGVVERIKDMEDSPSPGENAPWISEVCNKLCFSNFFCNAFAQADPEFMKQVMNKDAWFKAMLIKAFYGNRYEPGWAVSPVRSFELMPGVLGLQLRAIIERYQPIVNEQPGFLDVGGIQAEAPFNHPFVPTVARLAHLR